MKYESNAAGMPVRRQPCWISQSVATQQKGDRGYDAGKHTKGRKRHIVVDVLGLILAVAVTGANVQGPRWWPSGLKDRFARMARVWADGAYAGQLVEWAEKAAEFVLDIVRKPKGQIGFSVLPWRWIVERTFAWLGNYRRLARDYEISPRTSEAWIKIAMIHLMVRRLA
jgi:putative transposase